MAITHDVTVELFYSGAWHDHTATYDVYTGEATHGDDVNLGHGKGSWSGGITPAAATLVFRSWTFNPDNVSGPLYGLIGRNTPLRVTVDGDVRFEGEVSSWAPEQSLGGDVQVPDRWVGVEVGGDLRRIQAGTDPLPSSLKTFYRTASNTPVAYWTMEHGPLSRVALPEFGASTFNLSADPTARFVTADVAPWLEDGVGIGNGVFIAGPVAMPTSSGRWAVDHMRRAGSGDETREMDFVVRGNAESAGADRFDWILEFNPFQDELNFIQNLVSPAGQTSVLHDTVLVDVYDDQPHHIRLDLAQDGSGIDWDISIDGASVSTGTVAASTMQGVSQIIAVDRTGPGPVPTAFSHITVFDGVPPALADTTDAAFGYAGEHAGDRFVRLSAESGVTATVRGSAGDTVPMGPQFRGSLADQYAELADTDDGMVFDTPDGPGVTYKTGRDRYNQAAALTLDYDAFEVAPPLRPVLDDKELRNDVTAARRGGGTSRAVDEASVAAFGRYPGKPDVNLVSDLILEASAGWALHVGTSSGTRFADVTVDLDACPHLVPAVVATTVGDRIDLVHLPPELTPDTARLIVLGWAELAAADRRKVTFKCVPEAPFHVAEVAHAEYSTVGALDAFRTVGIISPGQTAITMNVGDDGPWVHEVDFDVVVNGERMTVTTVAAATGTFPNQSQVITVRRAANGVTGKSHPINSQMQLAHRAYIGL